MTALNIVWNETFKGIAPFQKVLLKIANSPTATPDICSGTYYAYDIFSSDIQVPEGYRVLAWAQLEEMNPSQTPEQEPTVEEDNEKTATEDAQVLLDLLIFEIFMDSFARGR